MTGKNYQPFVFFKYCVAWAGRKNVMAMCEEAVIVWTGSDARAAKDYSRALHFS